MEITQNLLLEILEYDEESGKLYWKHRGVHLFKDGVRWSAEQSCYRWNARYSGEEAGTCVDNWGYKTCRVFSKLYKNHRLIWMMKTGVWPDHVDHIDGDRINNKWENIRSVSQTNNNRNKCRSKANTSGVTGVRWNKKEKGWRVKIGDKWIGCFSNFDTAVRVRKEAEVEYGYHENHDRVSS